MTPEFKNQDGDPVDLEVRFVPLKKLSLLAGNISEEDQAVLFIAPQGRTPEQIREVFNSLDEGSQFELWNQGMELNEANLEKFNARKKKMAEASGLDIDKMVAEAVKTKMTDAMALLDLSKLDIDTATSPTNTVPMNSSTSPEDTSE